MSVCRIFDAEVQAKKEKQESEKTAWAETIEKALTDLQKDAGKDMQQEKDSACGYLLRRGSRQRQGDGSEDSSSDSHCPARKPKRRASSRSEKNSLKALCRVGCSSLPDTAV